MLPALILYLLKKKRSKKEICITLLFVILSFFIASAVMAQVKQLRYKIIQGGREVGFLHIQKKDSANSSLIKMESEAKRRIIFLITIYEWQETQLINNRIKYSYIYRKINGDVKSNKTIVKTVNGYEIRKKEAIIKTDFDSITHNQLSLYFEEPVNYFEVYSDQYQSMVKVKKNGTDGYKIDLPDGNTNYYYYKNNTCTRIKLEHSFFSAEFILTESN
jgi:lipopolysaccharide export LptBFGC system permease protein LptF